MIHGVGVDIIEIDRVKDAVSRERFCQRVFTGKEYAYAVARKNAFETYAGIFAAKEAVAKALGTGFGVFGMQDIEILHNSQNAPSVKLYGQAAALAQTHGAYRMWISISHNKTTAVAQAVWEA